MSNLASILDQQLPLAQFRKLRKAARISARYGVELFLVGGTVRDILQGHQPVDLDLSVVGATHQFISILTQELGGEVLARSQFGTSKIRLGNLVVDLALVRKENYSQPGALPTVESGSVQEDLARRDFTINAMAISLNAESWGDLLDPFGGRRDLEHRLIRVLHDRSFIDDATRILRGVRYAVRLEFQFETTTKELLKRDLTYLSTIKGDRIRHEVQRVFNEKCAVLTVGLAQELGVLSAIFPTLSLTDSLLEKIRQAGVEQSLGTNLLFLSLLSYSVPTNDHPGLMARLNMDARWSDVVRDTGLVRDTLTSIRSSNLRPSQLYKLLRPFDPAAIKGCVLASDDPRITQNGELYLTKLRPVKSSLNGDDIIALGVQRGPMVGKLLSELLAARLDGLITTKEEEEIFVIRWLHSTN